MCNLYRMTSNRAELASFFADLTTGLDAAPQGNAPAEIYPAFPATVLARGSLQQMIWGFPLQQTGAKGQPLKPKPVNNTRTDKLSSPFWSTSFRDRRCLIPISAYAEAEGQKGAKTRTWISLPGADLFTIAGIWRESDVWGRVFSMVTANACPPVQPVHHRMPVIIGPDDRPAWLEGLPQQAEKLCRPWRGPLQIDRSNILWNART